MNDETLHPAAQPTSGSAAPMGSRSKVPQAGATADSGRVQVHRRESLVDDGSSVSAADLEAIFLFRRLFLAHTSSRTCT